VADRVSGLLGLGGGNVKVGARAEELAAGGMNQHAALLKRR
jgi:hypothetical protein